MNDHHELVEKFITSFALVAETLDADEILDPIARQLATGPSDEYRYKVWSPIKVQTDAYALWTWKQAPSPLNAETQELSVRDCRAVLEMKRFRGKETEGSSFS